MPISQSGDALVSEQSYAQDGAERGLTAVDDGDGHEDTRAAADRAHEVGGDGQQAEDGTAERRGGRNDALELLVHRAFAVTGHDLHIQSVNSPVSQGRQRTICWSFSCFAMSRGPLPDTSIQVFEKMAQAEVMNAM